jgi:hypothetical protein
MLALNFGHTIGKIGDPDLNGPHDVKLPLYAMRGVIIMPEFCF